MAIEASGFFRLIRRRNYTTKSSKNLKDFRETFLISFCDFSLKNLSKFSQQFAFSADANAKIFYNVSNALAG